jgi:hypothetical protein
MKRLDKQTSRRRWRELRDKWNEYDPIGVMDDPDWPRDEYEAYVGPTLRLLEQGATVEDIVGYLEEASACMGLNFDRPNSLQHSAEFVFWYQDKWRNTKV